MGACVGCKDFGRELESITHSESANESFIADDDKTRSLIISGYIRKCWISLNMDDSFPSYKILKLIESYIALKYILFFDNLKYKNAINILTNWWNENIEVLSDDKYLEVATTFYINVFIHMPSAKEMFISRNVDMNAQSLKMLGMFRWIILTLNNSGLSNHTLIALQQLGALHDNIGLTMDHYLKAGDIFHETMSKTFINTYDLRVKWCFNILYEIIVGVMLGTDFNKMCNKQKNELLSLWKQIDDQHYSLNDCFKNKNIMQYLQLFMKEQFCIELLLFITDYNKYKLLFTKSNNNNNNNNNNDIVNTQPNINSFGQHINNLYIETNSKQQINISGVCRNLFYQKLQRQNNIYTDNIYDDCYDEVLQLIQLSVYPNFKQTIKECINSIKTVSSTLTKKIDFVYATNRSLLY